MNGVLTLRCLPVILRYVQSAVNNSRNHCGCSYPCLDRENHTCWLFYLSFRAKLLLIALFAAYHLLTPCRCPMSRHRWAHQCQSILFLPVVAFPVSGANETMSGSVREIRHGAQDGPKKLPKFSKLGCSSMFFNQNGTSPLLKRCSSIRMRLQLQ